MMIQKPTEHTFLGLGSGVFTRKLAMLNKTERAALRRAAVILQRIRDVAEDDDGSEPIIDIALAVGTLEEVADGGSVVLD